MFQQGGKFHLNASNWKRYQHLNNTNNNNNSRNPKTKDRYCDIDNPKKQKISKFSCHLKNLNRLKKTTRNTSNNTGLRKSNSLYSISSVKERLTNEAGSNTGIDIYRFKQKMANTLSVMTNVLRNVVSKQRIRYKEKGFNLDLAYVCENIIAMGYPADNYESMYRNPLGDVYKFLEDNHHDHYKIYNLCLERSYDITKFHGRVSVYPFEDHNPPTIELILSFCDDVDRWLKADPLNVAAVHCKAGKGRTGTMICCYLLYSGQQRSAEDALACYDEKRTKDRKGVTIPSQRRYVQYFSKLMRLGLQYERRTLQFCEIRFSKANTLHSQGTVHCSISVLQDKVQQLQNFPIDFRKNNILDMKNPSLPVAGDIKVELTKNTKKIFHFWFNTFFVTDSSVIEGEGNDVKYVYTLQKWEIDDVHKDKCYPEDFKVELVFYVDDTNVDRDDMKVSSSNRLTSNHRTTMQNAGTVRMSSQHQNQHQQQQQPQQQQSTNNYSLPQNNSSGSEMNYLCDQKSSSSTSVSSSLGVGGTDTSNGYESNKSTTQRKGGGGIVQTFNNHHHHNSNHYNVAANDVNNSSVIYTAPTPAQHMTLPPNYMEQHKTNMPPQKHHQQQQQQKNIATLAPTANQRHMQRAGEDLNVHHHPNNMDGNCQSSSSSSTNKINANKSSSSISSSSNNSSNNMAINSNSYNHNHHNNHSNNSSKTSSVSSQSSSSAIGDNEEDWESGESQAKQLEHITLLLSTSTITNPTSTLPPPPTPLTTTSPSKQSATPLNNTNKGNNSIQTSFPNTIRNYKNLNSGVSNSTNTSFSSSTSTSSSSKSTSTSNSTSSSTNCPSNNKSKTSNSSCTNRVVGGDDDDDNNENRNNDVDRKCKKVNSNHVVKQPVVVAPLNTTTTDDTNTKSVEFKVGDNNITNSVVREPEYVSAALVPATSTAPARPKLMHLLMAPKNPHQQQQQQQSPHKPIFKRKSSYKLVKSSNSNGSNSNFDNVDCSDDSLASSAALAAGGGVAMSSKLKLKIKLKKNKQKLSQKFQWFQNYFRTDPVDFCENFVQQTTSMRRNSMCSMASRTHKLSTTTPPSVTPPPPIVSEGASSSCEQLDRATSVTSVSTSNASIATGDLCEDYYSSICDNQLSFSNSPCKSPRSMADMASSINGGGAGSLGVGMGIGSFGSSFTRNATGISNSYLRERRETLPGCSSSHGNSRRNNNNVVIVAAKPAKIHAIGFNVNTTNLARQDSFETNGEEDNEEDVNDDDDVEASPASIYYTPSSALNSATGDAKENMNTAFVFPQITKESSAKMNSDSNGSSGNDLSLAGSLIKPQPKYSLNLVIVKECNEPECSSEITKTSSSGSTNESDGIDSDCCDLSHKRTDDVISAADDLESSGKVTATTTSASVCSNSSSSGFCTSECCTTNSSSSSCNCNPFALDLERHVATVKQEQQHNTIQEVIEINANDDNVHTTKQETNVNNVVENPSIELSLNSTIQEGTISTAISTTTSSSNECDQQCNDKDKDDGGEDV